MLKGIIWFIKDYISRHRHGINAILHIIGVPQAFYGLFQLVCGAWKIGLLNFFIGYLLQWIGHTYFEKNDVGEWILIKKLIGKIAKGRS